MNIPGCIDHNGNGFIFITHQINMILDIKLIMIKWYQEAFYLDLARIPTLNDSDIGTPLNGIPSTLMTSKYCSTSDINCW